MQQPLGFVDPSPPHFFCKLSNVIYGLKHAPQSWFSELSSWLFSYGFLASKTNHSLFIMHNSTVCMFLLVYVDDMILISSSQFVVAQLLASLSCAFPLKDLG